MTEDRKIEGLTLDFTIKANMSMANLPKLRRGLLTSAKVENENRGPVHQADQRQDALA